MAGVVPHPAEAGDGHRPRARGSGDVDPVVHVVVEVADVREGRLGPVVERQVQVSHLGRDDRLGGGGQRRVPHRAGLVVGEVACLLLWGEGVTSQVHGQDEVGLLDHLLAIELEVRVVQQQRVVLRRRPLEVPLAVVGEVRPTGRGRRSLRRTGSARSPPRRTSCRSPPGPPRAVLLRRASAGRPSAAARRFRWAIRFVKTLLSTTAVYSSGPVTPSIRKQSSGVNCPSDAHSRAVCTSSSTPQRGSELLVAGGRDVPSGGIGDVGVDMKSSSARGPVPGALLAVDGPPRECCAAAGPAPGPRQRRRQRVVAPGERTPGGLGRCVGQHRQHERLGVPEGVAVVPGSGEALRGDRLGLGARTGLQDVEHRDPHRLLQRRIPSISTSLRSQKRSMYSRCCASQVVPAGEPGHPERSVHLVP